MGMKWMENVKKKIRYKKMNKKIIKFWFRTTEDLALNLVQRKNLVKKPKFSTTQTFSTKT